jgi:hypothetical protein
MEIFNTKTVQILITHFWLETRWTFYTWFCLPYAFLLIFYIVWSNYLLWAEEQVVWAKTFDVLIALMCAEQLYIEAVQVGNQGYKYFSSWSNIWLDLLPCILLATISVMHLSNPELKKSSAFIWM